jgi:polyhydroxyalkanoate synthesis regulator phasin
MRAPELSKDQLESIVQNMVKKTNTDPDEFEELDLSRFSNIEEQIEFMKRQDRADSMTIS